VSCDRPQQHVKEVAYKPVYSPLGYNDLYVAEDPFGWDFVRVIEGIADYWLTVNALPLDISATRSPA
jgi:hypothetical protein